MKIYRIEKARERERKKGQRERERELRNGVRLFEDENSGSKQNLLKRVRVGRSYALSVKFPNFRLWRDRNNEMKREIERGAREMESKGFKFYLTRQFNPRFRISVSLVLSVLLRFSFSFPYSPKNLSSSYAPLFRFSGGVNGLFRLGLRGN